MMRSWGARPDTAVCDEPLYAHYLLKTGREHPGREEVIARHETDWRKVVEFLLGPVPGGKTIFYQKHMAHHLLSGMTIDWVDGLTNCFLIRDPREMILSLSKVLPDPALEETGLPQQWALFERARNRTGRTPPVVDAKDVLMDPRGTLAALCVRLGVPFTEAMLRWEPGPRPTDGVWGPHWYEAVYRSTGFEPYRERSEPTPAHLERLLADCRDIYQRLYEHRIT